MKTLLVTVAFALAVGACSSDSSNALVTGSRGRSRRGAVHADDGLRAQPGLTCAFPIVSDAGACVQEPDGLLRRDGAVRLRAVCPCGSTTSANVCVTRPTRPCPSTRTADVHDRPGGDGGTAPAGDAGGT